MAWSNVKQVSATWMPRLVWLLGGMLAGLAPAIAAEEPAALVKAQCAVCHGARGESTNVQFPQLAGQNAQYLRKQLEDFREGRRSHEAMTVISKALTDTQIEVLSLYFQHQTPQSHPTGDGQLASVGRYIFERGNIAAKVPACSAWHGGTGEGSARLPRLAGQHPQYVENQLRRFHSKQRRNDAGPMAFVTDGLSELELRAVAAYVGGLGSSASPR